MTMATEVTAVPVPRDATQPRRPLGLDGAAAAVRAEGLTKRFGSEVAVNNMTFDVPKGSIFGLIGPSGSGKTTAVRLMTGIYEPSEGHVNVLGRLPRQFNSTVRRKLGYMPQQFVLYPELSVWENMHFAAALYGMGLGRGKRLRSLLEFVELYEHRGKLARNISGGMQRRLSLAATLAHDPELIFLDEPTAGIDPILRAKFWDYFKELRERGRTLIITTQYVGEAAYCDLVGIMAEGRLLMVETPEGLRARAFGGEVVDLQSNQPLDYRVVTQIRALPFVQGRIQPLGESGLRIIVDDAGTAVPDLVEWARTNNLDVRSIEKFEAPLDDVFVEIVKKEQNSG
jgi:ABC-2 type transport system ATP-binding protein